MSCTEFQLALSELVDGTLSRDRRTQVEAHVQSCEDCRSAVADIRRIREQARALPKVAPTAALWEKVQADFDRQAGRLPHQAGRLPHQAGHLRQGSGAQGRLPHPDRQARGLSYGEVGKHGGLPHQEPPKIRAFVPRRRHVLAGLAAAAALMLATSAGVYYMTRQAAPVPQTEPASAHAQPAESVQSIESELQLAVQHYQNAITGLEKVAKEGQSVLDPQTAAVLTKSNAILDQAVSESQAALRTQPTSDVARASLFEALQRKVSLLRDTVALINEMRKGDAAGTARVVGSIGKS
jgi:anti-sigma factor RsiW